MMVAQISTAVELANYTGDPNKLTVIDFTASWCPPCRAIKPIFENFAIEHTGVNFIKVDLTDGTNELAEHYSVTAMPTFIFLVGTRVASKVVGANAAALQSNILKLSETASSGAFSGQGRTLSGKDQSLSGSSSFVHSTHNMSNSLIAIWSNMNPQAKVLLAICGAYAFFWLI